jgi:hypothetical protein
VDFIVEHGMYGILLEEGFEAVHPKLNKIIHNLKPMVDTKQRLERTSSRLMSSLNNAVERVLQAYAAKLSSCYSVRSTTYNTTGRSWNHESGIVFETGLVGEDNGNYLQSPDGKYLIQKE